MRERRKSMLNRYYLRVQLYTLELVGIELVTELKDLTV